MQTINVSNYHANTWTFHSTDRLDERYPEVGETVKAKRNEARENLETLATLALAEDKLQGRPELEELFTEDELSQMQQATSDIHGKRGALADPSNVSKNPLPKLSSLQAATCTVAASQKRCGRGAKTYRASDSESDNRLARVFYAERKASEEDHGSKEAAEWFDRYSPSEVYLLLHGDPKKGLGPCVVDPDVWLEYRSTLYQSFRSSSGGTVSYGSYHKYIGALLS